MKILVINSGSSSLKFQVIDSETERALAKGVCERIGIDGVFNYKTDAVALKEPVPMKNHKEAVNTLLKMLVDPERGVIGDFSEIDVVGHRLVHGGEKFTGSVVITDEVIAVMTECNDLAPLHNPANLGGGGGVQGADAGHADGGNLRYRVQPDHGAQGISLWTALPVL